MEVVVKMILDNALAYKKSGNLKKAQEALEDALLNVPMSEESKEVFKKEIAALTGTETPVETPQNDQLETFQSFIKQLDDQMTQPVKKAEPSMQLKLRELEEEINDLYDEINAIKNEIDHLNVITAKLKKKELLWRLDQLREWVYEKERERRHMIESLKQ